MSNGSGRILYKNMNHLCGNIVMLHGRIKIAANGSVAIADVSKELGASAVSISSGVVTLTLEDKYPALISCYLTVEASTAVDLVPQLKSSDVASAKTIVIDLNAGATPTSPSAITYIHILLMLRNTSISR